MQISLAGVKNRECDESVTNLQKRMQHTVLQMLTTVSIGETQSLSTMQQATTAVIDGVRLVTQHSAEPASSAFTALGLQCVFMRCYKMPNQ